MPDTTSQLTAVHRMSLTGSDADAVVQGTCNGSRNSLDPYYLVPHFYLGHIPPLFGSRWVVGYQVVGVLRVARKWVGSRELVLGLLA